MAALPWYFVAFVALTSALALLVVWARRRLAVRAGAVALLAALVAFEYLALTDLLSRPKPVALAPVGPELGEAQVLAASLHEGEAIYLWLRIADRPEPRYYVMPWRLETAVELEEAIREAERLGTRVAVRLPFEPSLDDRDHPRFYPLPRPRLPLKPLPEVQDYRHPSTAI